MTGLVPSSPPRWPGRAGERSPASLPLLRVPPPRLPPAGAFGGGGRPLAPPRGFPRGTVPHRASAPARRPRRYFFARFRAAGDEKSPRTPAQVPRRLRVPPLLPANTTHRHRELLPVSRFPAPGLRQAPSPPAAAARRGRWGSGGRRRGGGCSCDLIENTPAERRNPPGTPLPVTSVLTPTASRAPARPGAPLPPATGLAPGIALPSPFRPRPWPSGTCPSRPAARAAPRT